MLAPYNLLEKGKGGKRTVQDRLHMIHAGRCAQLGIQARYVSKNGLQVPLA